MRIPYPPAEAALSTLLFPFLTAAVASINCDHVRVDKTSFNLSPLGGPRSVLHSIDQGVTFKNATYTIDICNPLVRKGNVPKDQECPGGTRVCGIERLISKDGETDVIEKVIPIAGELQDRGGGSLDAKYTLLSKSSSHADSEKEGLRVELHGGFFLEDGKKRKQEAIVEFLCDREKTGLENLWDPEDKYTEKLAEKRDGDEETDGDKDDNSADGASTPSLTFLKYDTSGDSTDILRLEWRSKYACEGSKEEQDKENSSHWGFFTWFIIIAFLSTATYLIFGSWLNYNRYGARGWDLLPHGDTIRDVPYLLKDWTRRVLNTVQGGGSRGGYAAV